MYILFFKKSRVYTLLSPWEDLKTIERLCGIQIRVAVGNVMSSV